MKFIRGQSKVVVFLGSLVTLFFVGLNYHLIQEISILGVAAFSCGLATNGIIDYRHDQSISSLLIDLICFLLSLASLICAIIIVL